MSEQTPENVAAAAAVPDALPLSELTLIGVFLGDETGRALLRHPSGEIEAVAPGDTTAGQRVTALAPDYIILADRNGETTTLHLPDGS